MKKYLLLGALLPMTALAAPIKGFYSDYQDWDLVCNNTGTCYMAGYQSEESADNPVSILFTRKAGENAKVEALLQIYEDEPSSLNAAEIWLNGQSLGTVQLFEAPKKNTLSAKQTEALLNALKKDSEIRITAGKINQEISDKGAAAAMLRMDEFQQRLNTPSALIRKGNSNHPVLQPSSVKVKAVAIPNAKVANEGEKLTGEKAKSVFALLKKSDWGEDCSNFNKDVTDTDNEPYISVYPLTNGKVLVESSCLMFAYNFINYYAVMDDKLTQVEQVLAPQYNDVGYGEDHSFFVTGSFKSRGLGDCWNGSSAVWNGKIFIRTDEYTTGSCKGFPGGAWTMPIFESDTVVEKKVTLKEERK